MEKTNFIAIRNTERIEFQNNEDSKFINYYNSTHEIPSIDCNMKNEITFSSGKVSQKFFDMLSVIETLSHCEEPISFIMIQDWTIVKIW